MNWGKIRLVLCAQNYDHVLQREMWLCTVSYQYFYVSSWKIYQPVFLTYWLYSLYSSQQSTDRLQAPQLEQLSWICNKFPSVCCKPFVITSDLSQNKGQTKGLKLLAPPHCAHLWRTAVVPVCAPRPGKYHLPSPLPLRESTSACSRTCVSFTWHAGALGLPAWPGARGPVPETMRTLPRRRRASRPGEDARSDWNSGPRRQPTSTAEGEMGPPG